MASLQVHFSPGFPLGGGFPAEQFFQRGGKRPQEEKRGCSGGQRNKMRLLLRSSTALWRMVLQRELLRRYSDFRREGNFPESKLSGFCSGGIRNTQSTMCFPLAFCAFSYSHCQGCQLKFIKIPFKILLFSRF
jgi:hypothetical protein